MLTIYVDAYPVKEEVYRVARRYAMRVVVVANAPVRVPADALVELVVRPASAWPTTGSPSRPGQTKSSSRRTFR